MCKVLGNPQCYNKKTNTNNQILSFICLSEPRVLKTVNFLAFIKMAGCKLNRAEQLCSSASSDAIAYILVLVQRLVVFHGVQ
jgi:hypothetical protein